MIAEMVRPTTAPKYPPDEYTLGIGLYTPAEAALYARVRTQTLNRWVFGDARNSGVVEAQIANANERTVSFLDFVQTMAIRAIRSQFDVPLQKIRKAVDIASETFDTKYPFAMRHKTFVIREGSAAGELVLEREGHHVQISGKNKKQHLFGEIAELYMDQVQFGPDGLAAGYTAWGTGPDTIQMNPHIRFGEPIVADCGYSAHALWEAVRTEGGISAAADAYGVPENKIRLACSYFDHLINRDVA